MVRVTEEDRSGVRSVYTDPRVTRLKNIYITGR